LLAVTSVTATAEPTPLFPPSGRYVPITVSGTITQVLAYNLPHYETTRPTPRQMATINLAFAKQAAPATSIQVTDQYRQDEPAVNISIQETGTQSFFNASNPYVPQAVAGLIRNFSYTKTIYLQNKLGPYANQRQYAVDVYAQDTAGGLAANAFVYIPRHLSAKALIARPHPTHTTHLKARSY
jgi:hypothetical protein